MAEKKEEAKEESKEEAKGGGKTKLFIAIGVVVVLAGVGAFFALSGSKEKKSAEEEEVAAEEAGGHEGGEGGEAAVNKPAILPLDPFIVNLQVKGSFLKVTVQLEFAEPTIPPTVEHDLPIIRDAIIQILSSKAASDILTVEGKAKLREELRDGINEALGAEDVVEVYFTEFIIQ